MKAKNLNYKIYLLLAFLCCFVTSCSWESDDNSDIYDIIYLSRNGAEMPAHIHGNVDSKVFLIVLHGGPGGNGLEYRPGVFSEVLEDKYAVVYIDQRGQGMSIGHLEPETSTIEEMVEDVKAFGQIIKSKYGEDNSLFLLGHSWGGTLGTALMTTDDYQYDFKGWIEVDGAHDFDLLLRAQLKIFPKVSSEQLALGNNEDFWNSAVEMASEVDSLSYTLADIGTLNTLAFEAEANLLSDSILRDGTLDYISYPILFKSYFFSENPLTTYFSGNLTAGVLINDQGLIKNRMSDLFDIIEIPTLLLWGQYDFVVPPALGYQALNAISSEHKELIIFERSGHSPMSHEGPLFAEAVISFIDQHK